jgi:hypothetical protein
MVDAYLSENRESNYVYVRLSSSPPPGGTEAREISFAQNVLGRLDFAVAKTSWAVSAWISELPRLEAEERLRIIGRLAGYLLQKEGSQLEPDSTEETPELFLSQFA